MVGKYLNLTIFVMINGKIDVRMLALEDIRAMVDGVTIPGCGA